MRCFCCLYVNSKHLGESLKQYNLQGACAIHQSGPSCSKVTMSLVNVSLKLCLLIMAYTLYFCWKNVNSTFFQQKHFLIRYVCTRTVNILTTNEPVKLMMIWTTGPCSTVSCDYITGRKGPDQTAQMFTLIWVCQHIPFSCGMAQI